MSDEGYVSNQIAVRKNAKVLIELLDKLQPAPIEVYAHIHARADADANGYKRYSNIGVRMKDYSKGTGTDAVTVDANITPEEAVFLLTRVEAGFQIFDWSQQKIFGEADQVGNCQVTILTIKRVPTNSKGEAMNYPWIVECQNGVGQKGMRQNGGTYIQKGTYQKIFSVSTMLSDVDFFYLFYRAERYINLWESIWGPHLLNEGKRAIAARMAEKNNGMANAA